MKLKSWLNFAGILNIIIGILMFLFSNLTIIPVIFLIISGFFYRSYFNKEGPYKRRGTLIALGIFNLLFNFISGIIVLEVSSLIRKDDNYIKENKNTKINILLQLGIVLVLLSGIMIATNQTLIIPNIFKIIGLIFLSILFFILSYISKKYLKLESSYKTYFLLGMSFIIISFIGLYYYELLGTISYNHINYLYFYPLLFLIISICSFISFKILKNEKLAYITTTSTIMMISTWVNAFEVTLTLNALMISLILSLINFIYHPSCKLTEIATKVSHYLSIILLPINIIILIINDFNYISFILSIITTLNTFHIFVTKEDIFATYLSIPTLIINSLIIICKSAEVGEIKIVFFHVMMIVFYFLIKFISLGNNSIGFKNTYKILFNITFIITTIISYSISPTASLIITSLMLLQNLISIFETRKEELMLEPIKTLLFIISLILFINNNVDLDIIFNIFIIEIIELILYLIIKNKVLKNIHYGLYLTFVGLIALISQTTTDIFLALIALISSIIPIVIAIIKKSDKYIGITIFTSVALILCNSSLAFKEIHYFNYLLSFVLMGGYAYILKKDKYQKYILLYSIAILLLQLIETLTLSYDIYISLTLLIYSYVGLLIGSHITSKNSKDIFISIYFTILGLLNMFTSSTYIFITVCLITITMAIFGFIKDFKKIKFTAIILFAINLIYQLKDIWKDIPVAIYLLIIGLVLIGIVIVKEIKENK